ncbi:disease resistance protein RML1B-like [Bidens hawaiensis]|uniref:disease resistance protein RML1B-like n=1 Tax=Bidens hawaiensis TaxID=980011 RepID=UPI00404A55A3
MASSSSSNVMDDFGDEACWYDVFLSFCGQDTRNSFADHLYQGLKRAGIRTFRDNEAINKGEQLKPEIERAIKDSRASVVVLSKNYANSTWCLDELVLILEQRRDCNHFVLPVFYGVEPTDVRKQKGPFAIKVKRSSKWTAENVSKWKEALREVADLAGHVLNGLETNFLKNIVYTIYNKLGDKDVGLPPNMTGIDARYEITKSWLHQPNLEFLAIYGMGGSGKTTLAKYIYQANWKQFESVSFLEDIGHTCKRPNGLLAVQEQLLTDISGEKWTKVPGVSRGQSMIGKHLRMNRALIVLDGVVGYSQLVDLLGTGRINAHSKIVITTRENPDKWFCLSCWRCQIYEMKLLNDNESLELLCTHAFGSKSPVLGYEELIAQAIQYCQGNPLALKVLGSSMFKNSTVQNCKSQQNLLEKQIDSRIYDVLVRSYVSLPSDTVKELFLHIACFFIGKDMDYVVKILEPDFSAISGVETLVSTCLVSVSPNKTLMMHRLHQEMGKSVVFQESTKFPAKRSRIWLSSDSYNILSLGEGSKKVEGLAIDMKMLQNEGFAFTASELTTDALKNMDSLKLLQLNFVELSGSYERFSKHLRWLCWHGFHIATIPSDLYMGNLVAVDMSYSNLEVFEPPMVLQSLRILNLKDSHNLLEIRSIFKIPHLETLILWNCYSLVNVCRSIGDLTSLALLNMTGCKNLFRHTNLSTSGGVDTTQPTFFFPRSLHQLFLKDCHLVCTDSSPLSFSVQPDLHYLNLGSSLFENLPCYNSIESLRVLDLSFCSRLKCLLSLPSTLAELYISYCESLERITFQSPQFNLQEFGYKGCIHLYEIEGFFKLVPIAKLDETDLGHLKWLKEYQKYEMCLVGDDELTAGRSLHIQMLYEFNIMSTSLPDIKDPNMTSKITSVLPSLSFDVPLCPKNKRLEGIVVTFKYAISGYDWAWFCKISSPNGCVDLMYSPKVFGKPKYGEFGIWLSYWPIGNTLNIGDTVNVSIIVMSGLHVHECGVSLVYSDKETLETSTGHAETLGGDLSGFQLSTGAYYLCRHDFYEFIEVGRLTRACFSRIFGDVIDCMEVRGWRKTGRPKQVNESYTELKTVRCIINGPDLEDIYKIAEMSKASFGDKTVGLPSNLLEGEMKPGTKSEITEEAIEEIHGDQYMPSDETLGSFISAFNQIMMEESDSSSHVLNEGQRLHNYSIGGVERAPISSSRPYSPFQSHRLQKIVLAVTLSSDTERRKMVMVLRALQGVKYVDVDKKDGKLFVIGDVNPQTVVKYANKIADTNILSVEPASESLAEQDETEVKHGKEDEGPPKTKGSACSVM